MWIYVFSPRLSAAGKKADQMLTKTACCSDSVLNQNNKININQGCHLSWRRNLKLHALPVVTQYVCWLYFLCAYHTFVVHCVWSTMKYAILLLAVFAIQGNCTTFSVPVILISIHWHVMSLTDPKLDRYENCYLCNICYQVFEVKIVLAQTIRAISAPNPVIHQRMNAVETKIVYAMVTVAIVA